MAKKRREFAFQHIRTTGPMLPADVLSRVAIEDSKLPGLAGIDYGLAASERLGEAITRSWTRLLDIHRAFTEELAAADPADTVKSAKNSKSKPVCFSFSFCMSVLDFHAFFGCSRR